MGSEGRRSAAYRRTAALYRTGNFPCSLASGPWCTGQGTTVDHHPPLSTVAHPSLWRGEWRPACQPCQSRQGGQIANEMRGTQWEW